MRDPEHTTEAKDLGVGQKWDSGREMVKMMNFITDQIDLIRPPFAVGAHF